MKIPDYFYYEDKLWKKIKVVRSDSSVLAFCYQEQEKYFLSLAAVRRNFKKAFSLTQAAAMMRISKATLQSIFDKNLHVPPERVYDLSTLAPGRAYINEDDMLGLRQIAWELLPKNKYGIPYRDTMASEEELIHAMRLGDDRDFIVRDGDMVRIFRHDS